MHNQNSYLIFWRAYTTKSSEKDILIKVWNSLNSPFQCSTRVLVTSTAIYKCNKIIKNAIGTEFSIE